ncbi:MAG TPA: S9 family peptidase [Sphingopyxis sp.]|uniref:S9 family peptidase n=1 Tax=Sphingopyxis sp. TaxID=1908224 RepID=UPI002C07CAE8|nr:S9 family peptidase [Sphingopyxis sp.]HWW57042.1 S9 family peptidase [Sphingopyxis sp.]
MLSGTPERPLTDPRHLMSATRPDAQPVPIADLFFLRSSPSAAWTPSGDVVIATDLTGRINLWRVPGGGGFPVQLQQSEDKTLYPAAAPDGKTIFYASDIGGREIYDIFSIPADGGAAVNLTASPDASDRGPLRLSPDSRFLAFNRRVRTEPNTNVAVMNLGDRSVRLLTQEKEAGIIWSVVAFSPDGIHLYANRSNSSHSESAIWRIDMATAAATKVAGAEPGQPYEAAAAISPDGKSLSVTSENRLGVRQAVLLDLATGERREVHAGDWPQDAGAFSPDGRQLIAVENVDGRDRVYLYDVAKGRARALSLPDGKTADYDGTLPAFSPDGRRLLFPHSSGSAPFDYWTIDFASGEASRVTRLGLGSVNAQLLPRSEIVRYKSADGTVISAILWMPWNLKRDGSAPVVVMAHGGPTGQTSDSFDATATALASRGYMVIAPNVRGSTGYGRAFEHANHRDLGGRDLEDEAWAAKFLVASGYADPKKIGITGGSYGGFMTVMALGRMPDFWAAGVAAYGIVNWNTMWERGSPALREYQRGLIGDPVADREVYSRVSPLTYLRNTKAPMLVLQGQNDIRVPAHEAEQIVATLNEAGKVVEAHFYAEEGHGFQKRENQIDAAERTVAWFEKYLNRGK